MIVAELKHSDNKRVWEFRYKMQYEEPRIKVIDSKGNGDDITLLVIWNKER
jgi:hypothetical protein